MPAPCRNTCPNIDQAIACIHSLYEAIEEHNQQYNESAKRDGIAIMEELRDNNSALREWGDDEEERANDLDVRLDDALATIRDKDSEIDALKAYINELEATE